MNNGNIIWFLGIVMVLLVMWTIIVPCNHEKEGFNGIKPRLHATIDSDGNVSKVGPQSPSQDGRLGCTQVPCPQGIPDNVTCWCCCNFH